MFYNYSDIFHVIKVTALWWWSSSCSDCVDFTSQRWIHHTLITGNYWYTRLETAENNSEITKQRMCHFVTGMWGRFPGVTVGFAVSCGHLGLKGFHTLKSEKEFRRRFIFHQTISAAMKVSSYTPTMDKLFSFLSIPSRSTFCLVYRWGIEYKYLK